MYTLAGLLIFAAMVTLTAVAILAGLYVIVPHVHRTRYRRRTAPFKR